MLRLELKDDKDTVLFVNPEEGIEISRITRIYSEDPIIGSSDPPITSHQLIIGFPKSRKYPNNYEYSSKEDRDAAYKYVLNKINEYMFPQIEFGEVCCDKQ